MRTEQDAMFRLGSNHEFDLYFARAALEEMENGTVDSRRGSLPSAPPHQLIIKESHGPRRAASCKYPSRARRKGGSVSPRDKDGTPAKVLPENDSIPPTTHEVDNTQLEIQESTPPQQIQMAPAPPVDPSLLSPGGPRLDFKCHSAPHSRSSSWKKGRRPKSGFLEEIDQDMATRPRTGSVPLEDSISTRLEQLRLLQADDCCVVRNFTMSSKGLINRGDSFKRKSFSVASDQGSVGSGLGDGEHVFSVHSVGGSTAASSCAPPIFKVALIGAHGVGKTALVQQFMTSEYMGALETSFDDEREMTVSVLLDGEETMLELHDTPSSTDPSTVVDVDAYIVVYSITDRASFVHALSITNTLRKDRERHPAVIVVANKSDLVRSRQITTDEGREVCLLKDCKYIEVSAVLNHKVDELLVGVVSQIRLHPQRMERRKKPSSDECDIDISCTSGAKGLLQKLFKRQLFVSKSCDNLLVI